MVEENGQYKYIVCAKCKCKYLNCEECISR